MALRTLASGTIKKGAHNLYTAPTGRWAAISSVQIVNKSGSDCPLDLVMKSAGDEIHLTPDQFLFLNKYKIEHDQPIALAPHGYIKVTSGFDGLTFVVTGEERASES